MTDDYLQEASNQYAADLVERYSTGDDRIPPREVDRILNEVADKGGDVTMLERQLSGYVTSREVNKAKDAVDYSQVKEDFGDKLDQMLEDAGWGDGPVDHEPDPKPEEAAEGHWMPSDDDDSWETIQEKFGSGAMDSLTYERLREERGLEPMRA